MSNQFQRTADKQKARMNPEYIQRGIVKDNRDPQKMGRLKVWLEGSNSAEDNKSGWVTCDYATPFGGRTSGSPNANSYQEFPKSYGFWAVPPDINTIVFVFFINGRIEKSYWFGGTYDHLMNHSVPGPHTKVVGESTIDALYPVVDFDRNTTSADPDNHYVNVPLVDSLQQQNLLYDTEIGTPNRSARRQAPATVYGLSSPRGNHIVLDDGYTASELDAKTWDDDQEQYQETEYNNPANDTLKADRKAEGIVLRTRSGAQILVSESEGNIFVINRDGTVRMEFDPEGHFTVLADIDVSMRAKRDINFFAQRDINMESIRDINIKAGQNMKREVIGDTLNLYHGDVVTDITKNYRVYAKDTIRFKTDTSLSMFAPKEVKIEGGGGKATLNGDLHVQDNIKSGGDIHTASTSLNQHIHPAGGLLDSSGKPCSESTAAGNTGGAAQSSLASDPADDIIVEAFVPYKYEDVVDVNPDTAIAKKVAKDLAIVSDKSLSALCFVQPATGKITTYGYWGLNVAQADGTLVDRSGWLVRSSSSVVSIADGYVQERSDRHVVIDHKNGFISIYRGLKVYADTISGRELVLGAAIGDSDKQFEFEIRRSGSSVFGFAGSVDPGLFYIEQTSTKSAAANKSLSQGTTTNPICSITTSVSDIVSDVVKTIELESIISHLPLSGSLRRPATKSVSQARSQQNSLNIKLANDSIILDPSDTTPIDWVVTASDSTLLAEIKEDEGSAAYQSRYGYFLNGKFRVYQDSRGFDTIGYGHLVKSGEDFSNGLTEPQADSLLRKDLQNAVQQAKSIAESYKLRMPKAAQIVLTEQVFQLGAAGTRAFTKMLKAMKANDYKTAASEMRDSLWYTQTTNRVEKHARKIEQL